VTRGQLVFFALLSSSCATPDSSNRVSSEPRDSASNLGPCPVLRVNEERHDGVRIPCLVELELDQEHWPARYAAAAGWKLFGVEIRPDIAGTCRFALHDCRCESGVVLAIAKSAAGPAATRFVFAIRGAASFLGSGRFDLIRLDGGSGTLLESVPLDGSAAPPSKLNERLDCCEGSWFWTWKSPSGEIHPFVFSGVLPEGEKAPLVMRNLLLWSWNGPESCQIVQSKSPLSRPGCVMMGVIGYGPGGAWWELGQANLEKWPGAVLALNMSFEPTGS
jgi:hypothetical protein